MTHSPEVMERLYWTSNKDWYIFDPKYKYRYRLTEFAPERAQKSYAEWLKIQKI